MLTPRAAWAGDVDAQPTRVAYDAPARCPDVAAFKAQIQRRTPRFRDDEAAAFSLAVRVTVTDDSATARSW
jgi:hypothetical protein